MVGTGLSARTKRLDDSTQQVRVLAGEKWLTRRAFWLALKTDHELRVMLTNALRNAPFGAFFWETVPLSPERMDAPFECVIVDAPTLASVEASPEAFKDHFSSAMASVVSFPNLAGDSVLVVPCPTGRTYGHLAAFVRQAPDEQTDALWTRLGTEVAAWLGTRPMPLWVSTSGLAVPWLHVRLDARPKYYGFGPYKRSRRRSRQPPTYLRRPHFLSTELRCPSRTQWPAWERTGCVPCRSPWLDPALRGRGWFPPRPFANAGARPSQTRSDPRSAVH